MNEEKDIKEFLASLARPRPTDSKKQIDEKELERIRKELRDEERKEQLDLISSAKLRAEGLSDIKFYSAVVVKEYFPRDFAIYPENKKFKDFTTLNTTHSKKDVYDCVLGLLYPYEFGKHHIELYKEIYKEENMGEFDDNPLLQKIGYNSRLEDITEYDYSSKIVLLAVDPKKFIIPTYAEYEALGQSDGSYYVKGDDTKIADLKISLEDMVELIRDTSCDRNAQRYGAIYRKEYALIERGASMPEARADIQKAMIEQYMGQFIIKDHEFKEPIPPITDSTKLDLSAYAELQEINGIVQPFLSALNESIYISPEQKLDRFNQLSKYLEKEFFFIKTSRPRFKTESEFKDKKKGLTLFTQSLLDPECARTPRDMGNSLIIGGEVSQIMRKAATTKDPKDKNALFMYMELDYQSAETPQELIQQAKENCQNESFNKLMNDTYGGIELHLIYILSELFNEARIQQKQGRRNPSCFVFDDDTELSEEQRGFLRTVFAISHYGVIIDPEYLIERAGFPSVDTRHKKEQRKKVEEMLANIAKTPYSFITALSNGKMTIKRQEGRNLTVFTVCEWRESKREAKKEFWVFGQFDDTIVEPVGKIEGKEQSHNYDMIPLNFGRECLKRFDIRRADNYMKKFYRLLVKLCRQPSGRLLIDQSITPFDFFEDGMKDRSGSRNETIQELKDLFSDCGASLKFIRNEDGTKSVEIEAKMKELSSETRRIKKLGRGEEKK